MTDPPARNSDSSGDLVTVLRTANSAAIVVARMILESEGIRCHAKGEGLRDLTGLARLTTAFDPSFGAMELQVHARDAEDAHALLAELHKGASSDT